MFLAQGDAMVVAHVSLQPINRTRSKYEVLAEDFINVTLVMRPKLQIPLTLPHLT